MVAGHGSVSTYVIIVSSTYSSLWFFSCQSNGRKSRWSCTFRRRWATDAGYASLIFDYRGFGDSGGEPRSLVSLEKQYEDYLAVINWARTKSEMFHSDKIVVMGSATSGLSVARLVVEESGLAGGMGHSPLLDG